MRWFNSLKSLRTRIYEDFLGLEERLYRLTNTIIPFQLTDWSPVTITAKDGYTEYDYIPISTKILAFGLSRLTPKKDLTMVKPFASWSTEQQRTIGQIIPVEEEEDDSLEDFLWNKTGSFFRKDLTVDFSEMEKYPVKEPFLPYGGLVKFSSIGKIISIFYQGKTYTAPEIPRQIREVVRATAGVVSVIQVHLMRLHICTAQAHTIEWRKTVSKYTDLHQVVTFHTLDVNRNIPALIALFQNSYAFTKEGLHQFFLDSIAKGSLSTEEIYGNPGTPWYRETMAYRCEVENLLLSLYGEIDEKLLHHIVATSAGHNAFGDSMITNLVVNGMFPPAVRKTDTQGENLVSRLQSLNLRALGTFVSARPPLFADRAWWQHFPDPQPCENFQRWILQQNQGWFRPAFFEISIGV
ncbi:MAG: hypothetical protein ACYCQJ_13500 [Nitrososphaerales archaeon]